MWTRNPSRFTRRPGGAGARRSCAWATVTSCTMRMKNVRLIFSIVALHRFEQLFGVVSDAVLEDDFDVFDIRDARGGIALHHHEVRVLSGRDRADLILAAEKDRTVQRRDPNRLDRCESGLHQQLDLPLIAKARNVAANADGIRSR